MSKLRLWVILPCFIILVAGCATSRQRYAAFQVFEFDPSLPQVTNVGKSPVGESWKHILALRVRTEGSFPVMVSCTRSAKLQELFPVIEMFHAMGLKDVRVQFTDLDWNEVTVKNRIATGLIKK